jgi:uncharacterized protein
VGCQFTESSFVRKEVARRSAAYLPYMDRRAFLRGTLASGMGMSLGLGSGFWTRVFAAPAQPGPSPYGPLSTTPDANGLLLPDGFTSRIVAKALQPVGGTTFPWHAWPDGAACFPADDGGWVLVSNSENPPPADVPRPPGDLTAVLEQLGGVSAIRFDAAGDIVDAYPILRGSRSNCAGGVTPWGTWLSCEEWEDPGSFGTYDGGKVFECDPFGGSEPVDRPMLGRCKHEAAAVDTARHRIYLSEDLGDGLFYRFTPHTWGDLSAGALEAARLDDTGRVTWLPVPDPTAAAGSLRSQVPEATRFDGGEGCVYDDGKVYLTTKGDDRVWVHDVGAGTMTVLYDAAEYPDPVLDGVDNIIASTAGDLYVAEDGGNMEVCIITPDLVVAPVLRIVAQTSVGFPNPTPIPTSSEVTGLAFNPAGDRLYLSSQRGELFGITYEVQGPWRTSRPAAGKRAKPAKPKRPKRAA